jgi:hypothetical protein
MKERNMIQESDENNEQDLSSSVFDDEEDEVDDTKSELQRHLQRSNQ